MKNWFTGPYYQAARPDVSTAGTAGRADITKSLQTLWEMPCYVEQEGQSTHTSKTNPKTIEGPVCFQPNTNELNSIIHT